VLSVKIVVSSVKIGLVERYLLN